MKNTKKPKIMWAFWANAHGPWFKTPQKVILDKENGRWWKYGGEYDIEKAGLHQEVYCYLTFAHEDKKEVQKFIKGFMACRDLAGGFFRDEN